MGLNKSKQAQIDFRRQQVASMRLRGMTQREIQTALVGMGVVNPRTGKKYSIGTVNSDLQRLIQEWRDNAQRDIQELQAEILAQLQEVKRAAWAQKDLKAVLQALKQETRLMGLDAPQGIDLTTEGQPLKFTTIEVVKDYGEGSE